MAEAGSGFAEKFEGERYWDPLYGDKLIESVLFNCLHALEVGLDQVY